ncbi:hypothetical protein, partial [Salmonella enterica]|uniref:hypothetical protein n=3 Tax=Salmonella enterica TaxID=28901 RepID=UPI0030F1091A
TSEFGMGSGGTTALVPPGKFFCAQYAILYRISGVACARKLSHILLYAPSFPSLAALLLRKLLRTQL